MDRPIPVSKFTKEEDIVPFNKEEKREGVGKRGRSQKLGDFKPGVARKEKKVMKIGKKKKDWRRKNGE